jgi:hydrogenase maturation protein HypF
MILEEKSINIAVSGLVQGVGFRPFVYRIAVKNKLRGWVQNTNENVRIELTGSAENISHFLVSLEKEAPPAASIDHIEITETDLKYPVEFIILNSQNRSGDITEISPDIAVCDECINDMDKAGNRLDYAFVNCTNCGPRFTIIRDLPYDRAKTTMSLFPMCVDCRHEYETIHDRRFHAQPIACSNCGPHYELYVKGELISADSREIAVRTSECIDNAGITLMKGLGGMHLACDAFNQAAVEKLRILKSREGKPFAIMFRDMEHLKQYAETDSPEEESLTSWKRPIVLINKKTVFNKHQLPVQLNSGLGLLGIMLPYMPFHYNLFRFLKTPAIVLTSGNYSDEPILIDNIKAIKQFSAKVDAMVLHNRDIYNRTDDSVVRIMGGKERVFRRSRAYVPTPVRTLLKTEGIVAFGAELTNCFCVGKGKKAFLSQHIGDLRGLETTLFYEETISQFLKLFRVKPEILAVDLHPDYISTRTALNYVDLPIVQVQHHHAHIASCMVENQLDEKVIGVAFDGTGYGTDGNIWGSEFMICDLNDFKRISHFEYVPMPGGDSASEEPWRMAVSYLFKVYGDKFTELDLPFLKQIDSEKIRMVITMIDKKINCPFTSGAGRLFDAVASIMNLVQISTFQAEGPMLLESVVFRGVAGAYGFKTGSTICFDEMIRGIVDDVSKGEKKSTISAKFHNTIILSIFDSVKSMKLSEGINKVVLSGGVFQNKYLLEGVIEILELNNFEVYSHSLVPCNDGGVALGQLAVASKRRELKCV